MVKVGVSPYCMAFDSAKNLLYTACFSENRLKILDLSGYNITAIYKQAKVFTGQLYQRKKNIP